MTPVPTRHGAAAQWAGTVKGATRRKYASAVEAFNTFLSEKITGGRLYSTYDDALCDHLRALQRAGKGRQAGNLISAGLKHFRPGSRFPIASKVLKSWAARAPSKPWPCIPEAALILLVQEALLRGWINVAGWLMISFCCLPRISAASRMLFQDVALPGDPRFAGMSSDCFVVVGYDKRQKTPRMVDVYDNLGVELLYVLTETQPANDWRLFRASSSTLRQKMKTLCKALGWEHLNFVPHSLRYGGAVYDKSVRNLHVGDIQQRGRWRNPDTCLAYIQKGLGRLFRLNFPKSSEKELRGAAGIRKKLLRVLRRARRAPRGR